MVLSVLFIFKCVFKDIALKRKILVRFLLYKRQKAPGIDELNALALFYQRFIILRLQACKYYRTGNAL